LSWANKYSKIRVVCNDDDRHLLPQLAVDVAQANIDWGNALLQKGNRDKAKEKFERALTNLTEHAKKPDPAMIKQVTNKLAECK
jgi:predicted negative regulator of RcsB-dependent stress response